MNNSKVLPVMFGVMAIGAVAIVVWFGLFRGASPEYETVRLYYYNADNDKDASGNVMCSPAGLVLVERKLAVSPTPIQDTIRLLLEGDLTPQEKTSGISTEYPLPGVTLKGANLNDGELTLEFNDPEHKTGGGSCRVGILWNQIEATAKQFPEVASVEFIPEDLFQP